jgi:hypothetical protein
MALTDLEKKRRRDIRDARAKQADQQRGSDAALANALEPLLQGLFLEGHTHVAAASPCTVAKLACQLERLLIANGIVPQSKRADDPDAYAHDLQRIEDQGFRKEFKAQCREAMQKEVKD